MNKKDCEHIAFLLSEYKHDAELRHSLFRWDSRIKDDYTMFTESDSKQNAISERFNELMTAELGDHWGLLVTDAQGIKKEKWEQAKREIEKES
jgi:hypothetical protein